MIDQSILYAECPCGSGKKLKFCCYPAIRDDMPRDPTRADVTAAIRRRSQSARLAELSGGKAFLNLDRFHALIGQGLNQLHGGRCADAKETFMAAKKDFGMLPTAYNNLALCALVQGNVAEAEKMADEAVRRFPTENPFGMAMLADIRYLKGNVVGAMDVIERAEALEPPSVDQAARLCESMAHFKDHERILRYTEKSGYADDPEIALFRGIAFANLGRADEAMSCLKIALEGRQGDYAARILESVSVGRPPATICGDWMYFRPESFTLFAGLAKDIRKGGAQQADLSSEVIAEFVEVEANAGLIDIPTAITLLAQTMCKRTERMLDALRSDTSRSAEIRKAARAAYAKHFGAKGLGKRLRDVSAGSVQQMIITEEAVTQAPLDPAYEESYFKAVGICMDSKSQTPALREALRLLEDLHEKVPENPAVSNNYASVLSRLGRTTEAVAVLQACFAEHPDYVFGAANYLGFLISAGLLDEAKGLIESYRLPQRIHPDAWLAWWRAEERYYEAIGDRERLKNVRSSMRRVIREFKAPKR